MLCEENLNSDGQQFHKYQQITSHPHSLNTKDTMIYMYKAGYPGLGLGETHPVPLVFFLFIVTQL